MAARTDWTGVKTQVTLEQLSWRLEPSTWVRSRNSVVPLRLQKWRVVGDGRTTKEQIRDYATRCRDFSTTQKTSSHSEEGDDITVASTSLPAKEFDPPTSPIPTVEEEAYLKDRGQSSSVTHSMVEEGGMLPRSPSDRGAAPSSGSEFTNADGYISGQEEDSESDKEELEEDSVELTIKEAHDFKIFQPHDKEKRVPASILDLDFDSEKGQVGSVMLHLVGYCSNDSSGLFMRTIDSWSLKRDGEGKLELYVRDATKGLWIKLLRPFKEYELSVRGARLMAKLLEMTLTSTEIDAKKCLDKLEKIWSRDDIKTVLLKPYPSVVEKMVQSTEGSKFARMTDIVKNMESLLMGELKNGKPVASVKRPSSSIETKSENKRRRIEEVNPEIFPGIEVQKGSKNPTSTIPVSNKRKRVVESDSEDESGSEDHVPLSQRQFQFSGRSQANDLVLKDEVVENTVRRNKSDTDNVSRKHDQDSGASAGLWLSPAFTKNDTSPSWDEGGNDHEGQQEYQDIADAYGGQGDGLGEIVDDDDEELGDSAFCAICDDGGDLLLCDGPCMRSFHATEESAANSESQCRSLRYDPDTVRGMGSWKCPNCVSGQHQCFICGQLGRSVGDDKEVYVCDVALCGRFYHPGCLAKWKKEEKVNTITDEDAFIRSVKAGVGEFCCPAHKCRRCGEGEEEGGNDNSRKLAKCRRCPKAYHKVCLPKSISFENEPIRAWEIGDDEDPMKRLVMYCLTHEIVEALSTPKRNHLKWPKDSSSPEKVKHKDSLKGIGHMIQPTQKQRKVPKSTLTRKIPVHEEDEVSHGNYFKGAKLSSSRKSKSNTDFPASRERSASLLPKRGAPVLASIHPAPPRHGSLPRKNNPQSKGVAVNSVPKSFPTSTEGRRDRVLEIMRRAAQKVTLETVKENLAQPSCYGENRKKNFLHLGELQSMLNAIKKAAEKVKNGGSCEDAKRLCPKDYFLRFLKNEDMLKVHLAPILHGMRYTSFGRHFTCIDKLKEIVNRIHPYIESGDMIVDFCCGANDFSILLNEKLLSTGKTCQFKNFDIHPPKNDFCFTKGDWLLNQGHGFLEGKKLIMGLNPPFGVRAALANRFIIHALKFKPKLLVLIVPPETMSYSADYNAFGYDLVWEDKELLKGHAFYLPGSVDETDGENKTQWNVVPPPLYLWSSKDMTQKHRDIAVRYKHVESLTEDPLAPPSRRTPTATPSAREVPTLTIPSDKWTNSGSTPTECDTSSSRLQHSSATSSLADGHSQNSLEGSGHCVSAGGHRAAVQDSPLGRPNSVEKAVDDLAHHQLAATRQGLGRGTLGPSPGPGAGPPKNNQPSAQSHLTQNSSAAALSSQSGPPYSTFHRSVTMSATDSVSKQGNPNLTQSSSELVVKHGDANVKQSSPRGNQAQWGHVERPGPYYHEKNTSRSGMDGIERQQPGPQYPHRHPYMEPHRPLSLHGIQPQWLGPPGPSPPFNHGFQQRLPNQMWPPHPPPPPPPPPYHVPGMGPGVRPPFPPTPDPYFQGRPGPAERRPGAHQHDFHKESGGWLE